MLVFGTVLLGGDGLRSCEQVAEHAHFAREHTKKYVTATKA